ncbi:peroxidase family protein [Blastococcus sp. PRF04-17]|uniref:peroxidase family protein n=1 Tax=Blastococcus sp. PRF04-17 TaxID=2933797 RepID=UPI001FF1DEF5|nr:peroxidase family protein [Blastococcus sp. PRF04-17]UOY02221.1 peroxide synthase [Blastococcus sp. PRF04-17]
MPLIPPALERPVAIATDVLRYLPFGPRLVTSGFVALLANATAPRPRPLTLAGDYASWVSLTDRTFTGRHLPPAPADRRLPTEAEVLDLFRRRPGTEQPSTDTTVMFLLFAQWFTDSFLRTERSDWRKNTSTQEIDFCQIYGLSEAKARMLRSMQGGRLKSQQIDGQEFPPFLFERTASGGHAVKPEFKGLHDEDFLLDVLLAGVSDRQKDLFFAVGLEHGNSTIGSTSLDVLMVREHNRIAGLLAREYEEGRESPRWPRPMRDEDLDERLFQTTRLIMLVLLLKIVVEEYIRHIAPYDPPLKVLPGFAARKPWNRAGWIAVEFNLLYRWHMLVPETVTTEDGVVEAKSFLRDNNALVVEKGIEWVMAQASRSRASRIGLFNTPLFMTDRESPEHPSVEERSIGLMRFARLASYNDYRERFGMERKKSFAEVSSDPEVQRRLEQLYGDVDHLEWYVGIWAEDHPGDQIMGDLLTAMVGYDAFTQALTNPVLAPQVFTEDTFTRAGMTVIRKTGTLQDILARNITSPSAAVARFTHGSERRSWRRRR